MGKILSNFSQQKHRTPRIPAQTNLLWSVPGTQVGKGRRQFRYSNYEVNLYFTEIQLK